MSPNQLMLDMVRHKSLGVCIVLNRSRAFEKKGTKIVQENYRHYIFNKKSFKWWYMSKTLVLEKPGWKGEVQSMGLERRLSSGGTCCSYRGHEFASKHPFWAAHGCLKFQF